MIEWLASVVPVFWTAGAVAIFLGIQIVRWLMGDLDWTPQMGGVRDARQKRIASGELGMLEVMDGQRYLYEVGVGVDVYVTTRWRGFWPFRMRELVLEVPGIPRGLEVHKEGWRRDDDVIVGDPRFDTRVHISGDDEQVRAVANHQLRAELLELVRVGGRIEDGWVVWKTHTRARASTLRSRAQLMARVHRLIREVDDVGPTAALSRVVREDPLPEVRAGALSALKTRVGDRGRVVRELRHLAHDLRGQDRLTLAEATQDREIFQIMADDRREIGELRATGLLEAVRLGGRVDGTALRLVDEFLLAPSTTLRVAAIEVLAMPGGERRLDEVRARLDQALASPMADDAWLRSSDNGALLSALQVLTAHGDASDGRRLCEALAIAKDEAADAALVAVSSHATVGDVMRLRQLAEGGGRRLAGRIEQAIGAVKNRATGEAGALSVAEAGESGALSVTPSTRGSLTQAQDPVYRPSPE